MLRGKAARVVLFKMKTERSNVEFPMWRKKVDDSLLNDFMTPIPNWLSNVWDLESFTSNSKKDNSTKVDVIFEKQFFSGHVTKTVSKKKSGTNRRLFFEEELGNRLKHTFLKSYVRSIERKMSKSKNDLNVDWEFIDIEFDRSSNTFYLSAHYRTTVDFPNLFKQLVDSHILSDIENKLNNKQTSIFKSDWKERNELDKEIDAKNIIYNLIDIDNHEFYIGESKSLLKRLSVERPEIPNWTHYRFDVLPQSFGRLERLAIERLIIRTFASVLKSPHGKEINISNKFTLVNKKIDN